MSLRQNLLTGLLRVRKTLRARDEYDPTVPPERGAPPRGVDARAETIAGVPCWWLHESSPPDTVLVYLHGGSYVHQAVSIQWRGIDAIARDTGRRALFIDYPLAAEAPYPAALDRVVAVVGELRSRGATAVVLVGDSAGGGLAVAAAERLRDAGTPVDALMLLSPWLDVTVSSPGAAALEPGDAMLSISRLHAAGALYAGGADQRTPGISPLFGSAAGIPPTIVHVGDAELLLPEARAWTAAVRAAGGDVELHVVRRGFHVSAAFTWLPESAVARTEQRAFLRRVLPEGERRENR